MKKIFSSITVAIFVLFLAHVSYSASFERKFSTNNISGDDLCRVINLVFSEINNASEVINFSVNCSVDDGIWTDDACVTLNSSFERSDCIENEKYNKIVRVNNPSQGSWYYHEELRSLLNESNFGLRLIHMDLHYALITIPRCLEIITEDK